MRCHFASISERGILADIINIVFASSLSDTFKASNHFIPEVISFKLVQSRPLEGYQDQSRTKLVRRYHHGKARTKQYACLSMQWRTNQLVADGNIDKIYSEGTCPFIIAQITGRVLVKISNWCQAAKLQSLTGPPPVHTSVTPIFGCQNQTP